jgi:hypothetical protein
MSETYARIPAKFYDAHAARHTAPKALGRLHRVVLVDANDPLLPELLTAALASAAKGDESAKRTVQAIKEATS